MKIVIINGSARKGNTLTAINAFIKGASEKNEIEIIEPDKLNIAPCKGCGVCQCSKRCCSMRRIPLTAMILSILVDTFISKISLTMQPGPKIDSISGA
jgi:multimeric flavodoxin WrbA